MLAGSPSGQHCQTYRHLVMHLLNVAARKVAVLTAHTSEWVLSAPQSALMVETVLFIELFKVGRITDLRTLAILCNKIRVSFIILRKKS